MIRCRATRYQSWSGSAAAASEPMFSRMLFCKEDWEMHGVDVLHRGSCSMTDDDDSFS
jgi:actin-related protein